MALIKPTVDVVIPIYNTEKFIQRTLESVLAQTYPIQNIIVVNDGSTDHSLYIIEKMISELSLQSKIKVFTKPNGGHASAVNFGIMKSTADYIGLLDADDLWLPRKIELQIAKALENPEDGLIYCDYDVIDQDEHLIEWETRDRVVPKLKGKVSKTLIWKGNRISGSNSAVLIKRELLQKNLFNEKLKACEDWDLWIRLAKLTSFNYAEEQLVRIRRHGSNQSGDPVLMVRYTLMAVEDHIANFNYWKRKRIIFKQVMLRSIKDLIKHFSAIYEVLAPYGIFRIELVIAIIIEIPRRLIRKLIP